MTKRYTLTRVGAGPGQAIFACEHLLGERVEVVDAADYDALKRDLDYWKAGGGEWRRHDEKQAGRLERLEAAARAVVEAEDKGGFDISRRLLDAILELGKGLKDA